MSNLIGNLLSGGMLEGIRGIIGAFIPDPNRKAEIDLQIKQLVAANAQMIEETVRQEMASKEAIMRAELEQQDTFTKRARPSVVYVGLGVIIWNFCLCPTLLFALGKQAPEFNLPPEFWWAWTGICSAWVFGRTYEKAKGVSRASGLLTGSAGGKGAR